jgi:hypothetical protein
MPLPTINTPTYQTTLISSDKEISFRPFLVKEEKILLLAVESKDKKQTTKAIQTILKNCIQSKDVNIDQMPSFDLEYLFLQIRQKSLGEEIQVKLTCPETNNKFDYTINLSEIKVEKSDKLTNKIQINDEIGMIMKYPTFQTTQLLIEEESNTKKVFKIITSCIESIYDKNTTYNPNEYSEKELTEFVESMPQSAFEKINEFYENFPKMVYEKEIISPYSNNPMKVRLDNFMDFFA